MADRENVQMAGDYEIMQSFRMGGATMLIGYNPGDATYMTCYQNYDFWGNEHFSEAIGSENYVEIMDVFLQRLQEQTEKVKVFQAGRAIPVSVLEREHFPEVAKLFTEKVKQLFSFKEAQERAEKEAREKERQERIKARKSKRGMER